MAEEPNGTHKNEDTGVPDTWRVVELGALGLRIHGGGTPSTKNPAYWGGAIPWTTSAYIDDRLYLDRCAGFTTPEGLSNSSSQLVPKGNVLVGTRVGVGKVAINAIDTAISQDLTAIIVDSEQTCSEFLAYSIKSDAIQEEILSASRGTTIKGIPRADLIRIPIPLPPLPEQRRIATVLSAIQEAIAAQEDVIAAARHFKRSLMQRLFTYGPGREPAETKETEIGEIPVHWEVESVGKLADIRGGKRLPQGAIYADVVTEHPYIRVTDFIDNGVARTGLKYLTDETFQEIKRFIITSDDVYISIAGTTGLVGVIPTELSGANLTENAARFVIRDKDRILNRFLAQWLSHDAGQNQIQTRTTKTSQPKLALMRIQEIPVAVPPKTEQSAIVESIEAADAKIAAEEDRKTALEALFKSMLHQLMTGQIRLLTDEGLE